MSANHEQPTSTYRVSPNRESAGSEMPSKIGRYQLIRELGHGGFGTVYLARDTQLKRVVALKVLSRDKAQNPTLVRRFQAEAQAAAQLRHDNIVAVYDSGEADGYLFIAMEYVEGQDLFEMVQRRGDVSADHHFFNVDRRGNTGAAGAPSVLSEYWEQLADAPAIGVAVVGSGLTWAGALLERT